MSLRRTLKHILNHPMAEGDRIGSLYRFLGWQLRSRLGGGFHGVPFTDRAQLLVRRGMTGATGNIYNGLHEFEDMGLLLHLLRPNDLFVDVGANIGSYTVLASKVVGAKSISFEPVPETFEHLQRNVVANGITETVELHRVALGDVETTVQFTTAEDTMNHAVAEGEAVAECLEVPQRRLDDVLGGRTPILLKVDVEGFESAVVRGATDTLEQPSLVAVLLEMNGASRRYNFGDEALHSGMLSRGFRPAHYDPKTRTLEIVHEYERSGNTLYVRDVELVRRRIATAPQVRVLRTRI